MIAIPATLITVVLGGFIVGSRDLGFLTLFLVLGYAALVVAMVRSVRSTKDLLNPLFLLLVLLFFRYSLPGLKGVNPDIPLFQLMGLQDHEWNLGHVLALTGMLAVALGWFVAPIKGERAPNIRLSLPGEVRYTAGIGMAVGFLFLVLFVRSNTESVSETVLQGTFRTTLIREGTGQFFFLAILLISSSVVLTAYLLGRGGRRWTALLPVVLTTLSFLTLGGRARGLAPTVAGILLLWYARRFFPRRQRAQRSRYARPLLKGVLIGVPLALVIAAAGILYRSEQGGGIEAGAGAFSVEGIEQYLNSVLDTDIGQLHAVAGAVRLGPGVLEGRSLVTLLWPVSEILDLPGRSAGIYIVDETVGFFGRTWSVHSTLIGELYLNIGIIGAILMSFVFGMVLKFLYVGFRRGKVHAAIYALAAVYTWRLYIESIEKWGETLVALVAAFVVIRAASWFRVEAGPAPRGPESEGTRTPEPQAIRG